MYYSTSIAMVLENIFNLGLLMGAVLSFLLSIYLIFYPSQFLPNRILGALVFSWAMTVFMFIVQSPQFFSQYPHLFGSVDILTLLFFPLMYLYISYYLYPERKTTYRTLFHFVPALLSIPAFLPFFILTGDEKIYLIQNGIPKWFRSMQTVFNFIIIGQGIFYSVFSLRIMHHFQYFRKKRLSLIQLKYISWLHLFVSINILLWVTGTTGVILDILGVSLAVDLFKIFYFGLTLLTILLSIFAIKKPELFTERDEITNGALQTTDHSRSDEKPTSPDFQILSEYLKNKKPFLQNDLKMQDLVEATGLSYKRISQVFNNEYKKSFYDIMNELRVTEAIQLMKDDFHIKHTLPHLAEQAGFNSKTTFNRTFKKYTGKTPSEYILLLK